jgi:predicted GNAT family acetyltransferase
MADVTIIRTDTETKARYVATIEGVEGEGELTLSKVSDTLIIADHTGVPDTIRGMGVAGALAERLFADARSVSQRIVPLCPFVRGYAQKRKEETSDVIQW